jgi:zinc protease
MKKALSALLLVAACSSKAPKDKAEATAPKIKLSSISKVATYEPFPGLKIERYKLDKSGLDILLAPKPGTGAVAYVTAYNVGSRFEVKGRTGLAHLFEHMMFRGTENFPEPFKTLSNWGDRFNAYTSQDLTLYHQNVPKELLPQVAQFEAERMRKLQITPDGFNTERGAVVSERKMRTEDAPFGRLVWELQQTAFDVHPYKTGPIGWQEDLEATSFEDALKFYQRFYAPNRATLVIAGDFKTGDALDLIKKNYGAFDAQPWAEPEVHQEPERRDFRRKIIPMKAESVYMADAVRGITYKDPSVAAESLLCHLLADSARGYLYFELVEKGIARSVSADCWPNVDAAVSAVYVVANPGVSIEQLETAYDKARKGFLKWALESKRFEKAKLFYLGDQWQTLRDPMNLAEQLGSLTVTAGDPLYLFSFLEKVKRVSAKDIEERYKAWQKGRTRLFLKPSDKTAPMKRSAT